MTDIPGPKLKIIRDAIAGAFPSEPELEELLLFELDLKLAEFKGEGGHSHVVLRVVLKLHTDGRVGELMRAARRLKPNNPMLKACEQDVAPYLGDPVRERGQRGEGPKFSLPQIWRFDLQEPIGIVVEELEQERRLFGFVVACDDELFRSSFCDRLCYASGRSQMEIWPTTFGLNAFVPSHELIIKQRLNRRRRDDVIFRVHLAEPDPVVAHEMLALFWRELGAAMPADLPGRTIVLVFAPGEVQPAPGMVAIGAPQFRAVHFNEWFQNIAEHLGWQNLELIHKWRDQMHRECQFRERLQVSLVYAFLTRSLRTLDSPGASSPEGFLELLDQ